MIRGIPDKGIQKHQANVRHVRARDAHRRARDAYRCRLWTAQGAGALQH